MKKILTLLLAVSFYSADAQQDSTLPYLKDRMMPAFNLLSVDSVVFTQNSIAPDKPTIIMMFSPDCDHCQKQLDDLLAIPELTSTTQVVMISMAPVIYNREFYKKNKLEKYPFVYLGMDYQGLCLRYYKPHTVPVLVFYNKKREFVSIHQGNAGKNIILEGIKE